MNTRAKLAVVTLAASLMLATATSTASARRLSMSESNFTVTWKRFTYRGPSSIDCELTLSGSFHSRTINKSGYLIGVVNSASLGTCTDAATLLSETLPWHFTYNGFNGLLPDITVVRALLIGMAFRAGNPPCLLRSDITEPAGGAIEVNPITGKALDLDMDPNFGIDFDDPSFLCELAGNGSLEGSGAARTSSGSLLFFRLI